MMWRLLTTCAALIALGATLPAARNTVEQPGNVVVSALERELKSARVPGASYAVISAGQLLVGSYGVASVEGQVPVTSDTLMQVGSLNKLLTALALGVTLDQLKIPFDAPVGGHVAGLSRRLGAVTFHQLLSQTSGLRDQAGTGSSLDESALATRVRGIGDADFILPPGTVFSYSNIGYAAAGYALEHLRKKPYADALRDAVLEPLGMRRSTLRVPPEGTRAVGHRIEQSGTVPVMELDEDASLWPAGYLWSTAGELATLLPALVVKGSVVGGIPSSAIARLATPHTPMPNVFVGGHYGYGLMIANDRDTRIYEHGGTQRGFSSILRIAPDRQLGLVILTNLDGAPLRRVAQTVMAEALGVSKDVPVVHKETAVTPDEMRSLVGIYRNRGTAEIAVREDRVVLILDGGAPMPVSRIDENRYLARPRPDVAGPQFVLQPATPTSSAYLHFALWAYTR